MQIVDLLTHQGWGQWTNGRSLQEVKHRVRQQKLRYLFYIVLRYCTWGLKSHRHANFLQLDISTVALNNQQAEGAKTQEPQVVAQLWYHIWKQSVSALSLILFCWRHVGNSFRVVFVIVFELNLFTRTRTAQRRRARHWPRSILSRVTFA